MTVSLRGVALEAICEPSKLALQYNRRVFATYYVVSDSVRRDLKVAVSVYCDAVRAPFTRARHRAALLIHTFALSSNGESSLHTRVWIELAAGGARPVARPTQTNILTEDMFVCRRNEDFQ